MKIIAVAFLTISLSLAGCGKYAIGPDLDKLPTPFDQVSEVTLNGPDGFKATLGHKAEGDQIVMSHDILGGKTYRADVTYVPFLPRIAETNAERRDYWLAGLNFTQIPDRSVYVILRYPHGQTLTKGAQVEYLIVECTHITSKSSKAPEEIAVEKSADDKPAPPKPLVKKSIHPETDDFLDSIYDSKPDFNINRCELDNKDEARTLGPAVLERYTRIQQHALQIAKSDEERTEALKPFEWQALTVE